MSTAAEVATALLEDLAPYDVVAAQTLGREPASLMPALAPGDFAARHDVSVRARRALAGDDGSVLAQVLRERLDSDLALDAIGWTTSLLAPLATPVHAIRNVFETIPPERKAEHLALVPQALRDYAETLRSSPRTVARRQVLGAAEQCESWLPFFDSGHGLPQFIEFLRGELLDRAPAEDAVGRETYEVTSRAFLGDEVDLEETYAFGWDELASLTAEMATVAARLGASSTEEAAELLDGDPGRALPAYLLEGWLQSRLDATVGPWELPEQARLQARVSPTAVGVMYYEAPDPGFTRPGTVWWSAGRASSWQQVTTVHHEGLPGHHLQIVTALAAADLHPWQRTMVHVHGYAEGWAHYAERLADDWGLIRDDGERLGMLYGQRWRAARIVIDLGLHLKLGIPTNGFTEATEWSPEVGIEVLQKASRCDAVTAKFEIDRYLGWPAQALSFRVGARLWREIHRANPEDFPMRALRLGPMGLSTLRGVLT